MEKVSANDFDLPENELPVEHPPVEIIESDPKIKRVGWFVKEVIGIGIVNARGVLLAKKQS